MKLKLAFAVLLVSGAWTPAAGWEPVSTELLKAEKTGFGGATGVVVDRASGDVYLWLSDNGMYRSTDKGATWKPHGPRVKGRTELGGCMLTNPTGPLKSWVIALVYGGAIRTSDDAGETWRTLDAKSLHVDWVAVDWSDPERKFILTLKHEAGDLLMASSDGGKSFRDVGKGYGPACIFDSRTAVAVRITPGEAPKKAPKRTLVRTTDGGMTVEPVADFSAKVVPAWFDSTPYWIADGALISSDDKGATWKKLGALNGGVAGPAFGKTAKHLFVLTNAGIIESTDGGATWGKPIPLPKEMKGASALSWIAYDPQGDVLYVMKMGSELFRMKRGS